MRLVAVASALLAVGFSALPAAAGHGSALTALGSAGGQWFPMQGVRLGVDHADWEFTVGNGGVVFFGGGDEKTGFRGTSLLCCESASFETGPLRMSPVGTFHATFTYCTGWGCYNGVIDGALA